MCRNLKILVFSLLTFAMFSETADATLFGHWGGGCCGPMPLMMPRVPRRCAILDRRIARLERRRDRVCSRCRGIGCRARCFRPTFPIPTVCPTIVPTTTYVPCTTTTMETVPRIVTRRQAYTTTVPVTTYTNVVVDEGSYQQIWVPKMVTKSVPQTSYQQQVQYKDVAVQVNDQVPVVTTRYVPRTVNRIVNRPACLTCPPIATPTAPAQIFNAPTVMPNQTFQAPQTLLPPSGLPAPNGNAVPAPTPDPNMQTPTSWVPIESRTSALPTTNNTAANGGYRTIAPPQQASTSSPYVARAWQPIQ